MQNTQEAEKWERMYAIVNQFTLPPTKTKLFIKRLIAENILTLLLQYSGLMFSTISEHSFPIWFATGTASAFVFMRGFSVLPGIWLGSFIAYFFAHAGLSLAIFTATLLTAQAYLLLRLCYRFSGQALYFEQISAYVKFILCTLIVTALAQSLLGLAIPRYASISAWLANFNGIIIVACAIVTWDAYFPELDRLQHCNRLVLSLLFGLLITLSLIALFSQHVFLLSCALGSLTLSIAWVYGWGGAMAAVFLSGLIFTFGAGIHMQLALTLETLAAMLLALSQSNQKYGN